MAAKRRPLVFSLVGKTRNEIAEQLADADHEKLVDLVFLLASFDQCLTPKQIADRTQRNRREVIEDMKAGRFVDPIYGPGFFCMGNNSYRVTAAAARAWLERFFVRPDRIPDRKREPELDIVDAVARYGLTKTDLVGPTAGQKQVLIAGCSDSASSNGGPA